MPYAPTAPRRTDPTHARALEALLDELDAHAAAGRPTPCISSRIGRLWISSDPDEQAAAARACATCPALIACRRYALSHPHEAGVLGGTTEADRAQRTTCRRGHELTPANTYRTPRGYLECRTCRTAASTRHRTTTTSEVEPCRPPN